MTTTAPRHVVLLTLCVMLATIMQALDTTIANVALPYRAGLAVGDDRPDQLGADVLHRGCCHRDAGHGLLRATTWPQAVVPDRGRGASKAHPSCAALQLRCPKCVLFRLLQGLFGASLVPLCKAVLLDYLSEGKSTAQRCAVGILGVMVGPILGPTLGNW